MDNGQSTYTGGLSLVEKLFLDSNTSRYKGGRDREKRRISESLHFTKKDLNDHIKRAKNPKRLIYFSIYVESSFLHLHTTLPPMNKGFY